LQRFTQSMRKRLAPHARSAMMRPASPRRLK
jgi:hypothetical protein